MSIFRIKRFSFIQRVFSEELSDIERMASSFQKRANEATDPAKRKAYQHKADMLNERANYIREHMRSGTGNSSGSFTGNRGSSFSGNNRGGSSSSNNNRGGSSSGNNNRGGGSSGGGGNTPHTNTPPRPSSRPSSRVNWDKVRYATAAALGAYALYNYYQYKKEKEEREKARQKQR